VLDESAALSAGDDAKGDDENHHQGPIRRRRSAELRRIKVTTAEHPVDLKVENPSDRPAGATSFPGRSASFGLNAVILRSEALAALVAGAGIWLVNGGSALWLLPAILLPDISMLGYLVNSRVGAVTYNAIHNWTLAFTALGLGWWLRIDPLLLVGALLLAHVGMDRALGYGLKLRTHFRDTHLGRVGRDRPATGST